MTTMQTTPPLIEQFLILCKGQSVDKNFYKKIEEHVAGRLHLIANRPKSLKEICSPEFWSGLSNGEKRLAGTCVAAMVDRGVLPMHRFVHAHEYPKKYSRFI